MRHNADCIILTKENKILLQQRPVHWERAGGCLVTFGGKIENNESDQQAICREIKEELGAEIAPTELIKIGDFEDHFSDHTELSHLYFWHDKTGKITGCYEGEAVYYDQINAALNHPQIMSYLARALLQCKKMALLK